MCVISVPLFALIPTNTEEPKRNHVELEEVDYENKGTTPPPEGSPPPGSPTPGIEQNKDRIAVSSQKQGESVILNLIEGMSPSQKKALGFGLAIFCGILFGINYLPVQYD